MNQKIRWGVLGAARIATKKVIPGMQKGEWSEVAAIASRDSAKAREAADSLSIPKAYGSYEELLADPEIDAIYNPLPNHLHVPWSARAAEAGKHVLCEKPLSLTAAEARSLIEVRNRTGRKMGEAFMVHTHPQWVRAREMVRSGSLGSVRAILGYFSYFNDDPANIRNVPHYGGGALMDIGCYMITAPRYFYGEEPLRVIGLVEPDPQMRTDRLTSALMEFPSGHAMFTCSTQLVPSQRLQILGTKRRLEIEVPVNAPPDHPCRILIDDGRDVLGSGVEPMEFETCDQYTIQGDLFSRAILEDTEVPVPLEHGILNMAVIEAIFRSASTGQWEQPEPL